MPRNRAGDAAHRLQRSFSVSERSTVPASVSLVSPPAGGRILTANTDQPLAALAWEELEDHRAQTRRDRHPLWWRWVGASVAVYVAIALVGTAIWGFELSPPKAEPRTCADYSEYLLFLAPAPLGWLILRRLGSLKADAWRWPAATLAGCVIGATVFTVIDVAAGDLRSPSERRGPDAVATFVDFVAVGSAQALVLRRFLARWPGHPKKRRWVWWTGLAIAAGFIAALMAAAPPETSETPFTFPSRWIELLVAALGSAFVALPLAGTHAFILCRIFYPTPKLQRAT